MVWYGVDESWELCCNKGCLTKYTKYEVNLPDGRKKTIWLCPGCQYQNIHIMGRYIWLRERVDWLQQVVGKVKILEAGIERLKAVSQKALMEKEKKIKELEAKIFELERRLRFPRRKAKKRGVISKLKEFLKKKSRRKKLK